MKIWNLLVFCAFLPPPISTKEILSFPLWISEHLVQMFTQCVNICNSAKFKNWNLTPKMILGGRVFWGRWSGHQGEQWEWCPYKIGRREPSLLLVCEDTLKRCHLWSQTWALLDTESTSVSIMNFPTSQSVNNKTSYL